MTIFVNVVIGFLFLGTIRCERMDETLRRQIMGKSFRSNDTTKSNRTLVKFIMATPFFMGSVFVASPLEALRRLRSFENLLPNYDVDIEWIDDWCTSSIHVTEIGKRFHASEKSSNRLPIVSTAGCDGVGLKLIGEVASYFNHISFTWACSNRAVFNDRDRFGSLFPLGESYREIYRSITLFIERYNWTKVALITERNNFYGDISEILFQLLRESNIEISFFQRVAYQEYDEEEHNQVMTEMAGVDPRIIIVYADFSVAKVCWFHRMGLYGPNYVFFIFALSDLSDFTNIYIMPEIADWCSETMVREVLETTFLFGETSRAKFVEHDDFGVSLEEYDRTMNEHVENIGGEWSFGCCRLFTHDLTMFIGLVLNKTEEILQTTRNETLSDWFVDSENFQANGSVISSILKESIYQVSYRGLSGEINFDPATKMNTLGYTPVQISQQIGGVEKVVAIYKSNNRQGEKLSVYEDLLVWRGPNHQQPLDQVEIQKATFGTLSFGYFAIFSILAVIEIIIILVFLLRRRQHGKNRNPLLLIAGSTILLVSHIFILPNNNFISYHCNVIVGFLLFACSIILIGYSFLLVTLQLDNEAQTTKSRSKIKSTGTQQGIPTLAFKVKEAIERKKRNAKSEKVFVIVLFFLSVILATSAIAYQSMETHQRSAMSAESTIGKRSVELNIYMQCGFDEKKEVGPWLVLLQILPIPLAVIRAGLCISEMQNSRILNKSSSSSGISIIVNCFGITLTLVIGSSLIAYIMLWQLFHVTAVSTLFIAIPSIVLIYRQ